MKPLQPKVHCVIDEALLQAIVLACSLLQSPIVFKTLYLLAFYSFLRLSNILPHSISSFDTTRHLCVCDVIFAQEFAVVIVNWSKTMLQFQQYLIFCRCRHQRMIHFFRFRQGVDLPPSQILWLGNTLSNFLSSLTLLKSSLFMISGGFQGWRLSSGYTGSRYLVI